MTHSEYLKNNLKQMYKQLISCVKYFSIFFVLFIQNDDIFTKKKINPLSLRPLKCDFLKHKNTIVVAVFWRNNLLYITKISILFVLN